jgi:hypothetical protein
MKKENVPVARKHITFSTAQSSKLLNQPSKQLSSEETKFVTIVSSESTTPKNVKQMKARNVELMNVNDIIT